MKRAVMLVGTGSDVGKTTLVTGLCRALSNRGVRVAPFKAQNMALESVVTEDGGEIARATAVQAAAARVEPTVDMNPILLKPKDDRCSQLVVHGRPERDVTAMDYFGTSGLAELKQRAIAASLDRLCGRHDCIVAEGAGSCAEPNLYARDVVNLAIARRLDARAFLVADIDKGGAFAQLLGTIATIEHIAPGDLELVAGFVLNKFRGDLRLLDDALRFVERHTGKPVVGVLPYLELALEQEDRLRPVACDAPEVDIAVIYLPHISNASDLAPLASDTAVRVRYVRSADELGAPDAIVLPGTKNTTWDLELLRRTGLAHAMLRDRRATIVGICGGFQMLGRRLHDEHRLESPLGSVPGLGLLDLDVEFRPGKVLRRDSFSPTPDNPLRAAGPVSGYEIHSGHVERGACAALFTDSRGRAEGAVSRDGRVLGTLVHDVFWNPRLARAFVDLLRAGKGLPPLDTPPPDLRARREASLEHLAAAVAEHCPGLVDAGLGVGA
jgi:adenosylcobyric acid synthase